jgi:mannosyltransferase
MSTFPTLTITQSNLLKNQPIQLILGNSNKRFSGVSSTMLQVLAYQRDLMSVAVLGKHHLPEGITHLNYREFIKLCRNPLPDGSSRIFHARRNDEMIQALIARTLFGAKIKIVFTSTAQRYHSKFTRWLMSKMDAVITTCSAAGFYLRNAADIVIPHGIDIDTYTLKSETYNPDKIRIGVFGRVRPSKGIDLLVDAIIPILKSHPQVSLTVCGETTQKFQPYLIEQKEKIAQANVSDQVDFLGKVEFSELPKLYRSMDIVCAVSRNEGYGLTPLEAMASGVAVLTSEAGAWKDIVENGVHGYCVLTDNINAIQDKLEHMISDPKKLTEMGRAGRIHVEKHYTNKREAEQLCEFFKQLK